MWSYTHTGKNSQISHELRLLHFFLYFWNVQDNAVMESLHKKLSFFGTICLLKICPPQGFPWPSWKLKQKLNYHKTFWGLLNLFWNYMNEVLVTDALSTWMCSLRNRECTPLFWLLLLWQQCSDPWGETEKAQK